MHVFVIPSFGAANNICMHTKFYYLLTAMCTSPYVACGNWWNLVHDKKVDTSQTLVINGLEKCKKNVALR